jgi:nitroreductase
VNPIDELLTTTRSARKTLDVTAPVDVDVITECLRIGIQAPNGTNQQSWKWLVIDDPDIRRQLSEVYREAYLEMTGGNYVGEAFGDSDFGRVMTSTEWLVEHLAEVPAIVIPCFEPYVPRQDGDEQFHNATVYGSIFPAVWNFQLALRSRGYGTCITTLHLNHAQQVEELLGIPPTFVQGCLLPVAKLRVAVTTAAPRRPLSEVTARNRWNGPSL